MAELDYDIRAALEHNPQPGLSVDDIEAVEASWTNGEDEPSFAWLWRLKDGRYVAEPSQSSGAGYVPVMDE